MVEEQFEIHPKPRVIQAYGDELNGWDEGRGNIMIHHPYVGMEFNVALYARLPLINEAHTEESTSKEILLQ